ncbi:SEC-C domain-containing protein [Streptomyces violascens]|uniref:SEC-C domain-containing protein n=1 Tax=Streptomyces violascens TaxID=67381 RepID=UPI00365C288F
MSAKRPRQAARDQHSPAAAVAELSALAEQYPEDREEILLEAATVWCEAKEYGRAVAVYDMLLAGTCEEPDMVAAYRIGALWDAGREDDFRRAARELRARHPHHWAPWHFVAETFEDAEDFHSAAEWCTAGISHLIGVGTRLTAAGAAASHQDLESLLITRHRVRRRLGEPHDDWDEAADQAHAGRSGLTGSEFTLDELHDPDYQARLGSEDPEVLRKEIDRLTDEVAQRRAHLHAPRMTCALFWPEEEFSELLRRWPALAGHYGTDHAEHLDGVERLLHSYSDLGHPRLGTTPGTVQGLIAFARDEDQDPADGGLRAQYAAGLAARGLAAPWPPPRNGPCWCGSDRKYKKCHGSPAKT